MTRPDETTVREALREIETLAISVVSTVPEYTENGHRLRTNEKLQRLEEARERWVRWFTTGEKGWETTEPE